MDISGPHSVAATLALRVAPQALLESWKIGQQLQALVISTRDSGQTTLTIGGVPFSAQSPLPLQPGQQLQLEVTQLARLAELALLNARGQQQPVRISLPALGHLLPQWRPGVILDALAIGRGAQNALLLDIAGQRLLAQSTGALTPGQVLKLEIIDPGKIAALRILNPTSTTDTERVSQAWRAALPQQGSLAPLLANLAALVQPVMTRGTAAANPLQQSLPQPIVDIIRGIVTRLPSDQSISSAEGLRQAVAQSGLFTEARLAQLVAQQTPQQAQPGQPLPALPTLPLDFKGGLLGLLVTLLSLTGRTPLPAPASGAVPAPPFPAALPGAAAAAHGHNQNQPARQERPGALLQVLQDFIRQVESGLSRLQVTQLSSTAVEDDSKRQWIIDLPVRHDARIDLFQCRIEQDARGQGRKREPVWNVNLSFDLPGLGPIQTRITLLQGVISTTFWAEQAGTVSVIKDHLQMLQQRLREAGLNIGSLQALQGKNPEPEPAPAAIPQVLLDVKA